MADYEFLWENPEALKPVAAEEPAPVEFPWEPGYKEDTRSDIKRGFDTSIGQIVPTLKGAVGLIGAAAEQGVGEGGIATAVKDWGFKGHQDGMKKLAPLAKENDDFTTVIDKVKEGDLGAMVDWVQYGIGYGIGQIAETGAVAVTGGILGAAAGGGVGAPVTAPAGAGAAVLGGSAAKIAIKKFVQESVEKKTAELVAQGITKDVAEKQAAKVIGRNLALAGHNTGMAGGNIYASAEAEARENGETLDGMDIARVIGSAIVSGKLETLADKVGIDALFGKAAAGSSRAVRAASSAAAVGATEVGTEVAQTAAERFGAKKDLTSDEAVKDYINSGALGGLMGGGMGAVGGALSKKRTPPPIEPILTAPDVETATAETQKALAQTLANVDDVDLPEKFLRDTRAGAAEGSAGALESLIQEQKETIATLTSAREGLMSQEAAGAAAIADPATSPEAAAAVAEVKAVAEAGAAAPADPQATAMAVENANVAGRPVDAGADVGPSLPSDIPQSAAGVSDRSLGIQGGTASPDAQSVGLPSGSGGVADGGTTPANAALGVRPYAEPDVVKIALLQKQLDSVDAHIAKFPPDSKFHAQGLQARGKIVTRMEAAVAEAEAKLPPAPVAEVAAEDSKNPLSRTVPPTILDAIAAQGGMSMKDARASFPGISEEDLQRTIGGQRVFHRDGQSIETMRTNLATEGFLDPEATTELEEKVGLSLGGNPQYTGADAETAGQLAAVAEPTDSLWTGEAEAALSQLDDAAVARLKKDAWDDGISDEELDRVEAELDRMEEEGSDEGTEEALAQEESGASEDGVGEEEDLTKRPSALLGGRKTETTKPVATLLSQTPGTGGETVAPAKIPSADLLGGTKTPEAVKSAPALLRSLKAGETAKGTTEVRVNFLPETRTKNANGSTTLSQREARMVQKLGRLFGKRVVFFQGDVDYDGYVKNDGDNSVLYININASSAHHLVVAGHEIAHLMKRDHPDLYQALVDRLLPEISKGNLEKFARYYDKFESRDLVEKRLREKPTETNAQIWARLKEGSETTTETYDRVKQEMTDAQVEELLRDPTTTDKIVEEFISDLIGNRAGELRTFTKLFGAAKRDGDRNLIYQIGQFIMDFVDGLLAKIKIEKFETSDAMVKDLRNARKDIRETLLLYAKAQNQNGTLEMIKAQRDNIIAARTTVQPERIPGTLSMSKKRDVTESPPFRAWFKQSAVVDKAGKPLVVYHGTGERFEAFSKDAIGTEYGQDDVGFYFTDKKETAEGYARNTSYGMLRREPGSVIKTYLSIQNPYVVSIDFDPVSEWDDRHAELVAAAKAGGHDGVIVKADKGESMYVAFEPNQIKSADKNSGAFDPADERITKSKKRASATADNTGATPTTEIIENGNAETRQAGREEPEERAAEGGEEASGNLPLDGRDPSTVGPGAGGRQAGEAELSTKDRLAQKIASVTKSKKREPAVAANIAMGQKAMEKALTEKADVNRAMFRPGLGWVDFRWGDAKHGVSHILARRQDADGMTLAEAEQFLRDGLVKTVALGVQTRSLDVKGSLKLTIEHEGNRAVLIKNPASNAWLLTGFELKPGGQAAVSDAILPTQSAPTPSRRESGAGPYTVQPDAQDGKQDPDVTKSTKREGVLRDPDGKAIPFYHGTAGDFATFDPMEAKRKKRTDAPNVFSYFTSSPKVASGYAKRHRGGANVRKVTLAFQNPLRVDAKGGSYSAVTTPIGGRLFSARYGQETEIEVGDAISINDLALLASRAGHDGLIVDNVTDPALPRSSEPATTAVAFKPDQIRSAFEQEIDDRITKSTKRADPGITEGDERIPGTLSDPNITKSTKRNVLPAADYYGDPGIRELAHGIRDGDQKSILAAAEKMAPSVPAGSVLVPIPSRTGRAAATLRLAREIAKISGSEVADVLRGKTRESQMDRKKAGAPMTADDFGYVVAGKVPENAILIDNVFDTGATSDAAQAVLPGSQTLVLATVSERIPGTLSDPEITKSTKRDRGFIGDVTPAQEAALRNVGGIVVPETRKERMAKLTANLGIRVKQGLVDQFAAIKEIDPKAYLLARMSKGSEGALEAMMMYGKVTIRDGLYDVKVGPDGGFARVLADLEGEHDRFLWWVAAQRAEKLKAEGRENLFTDTDIADLKTLNVGREAKFTKALAELNAYNESVLKIALDSGLIDADAFQMFRDQPYVPFYRVMADENAPGGPTFSSGMKGQYASKKLKGGKEALNQDLLSNMMQNWSHLFSASIRTRAMEQTMTTAESMGVAYPVPSGTKGSIKFMRQGSTQHYMVEDPYLFEAISAVDAQTPSWMAPFSKFKQILTVGVTASPTFKIRNLIRDSLGAIAQADLSYNPARNIAEGFAATARGSQTYASMLASGGVIKFGAMADGASGVQRMVRKAAKSGTTVLDRQGMEKLTGQMADLWEMYNEKGDRFENANRAALYQQMIAKGKSHAEASFMSRDLMDFSMSGRWPVVRFLAQSIPFLNARIIGLNRLVQGAQEDPRRMGYMVAAVAMASIALAMAQGDDEDFKKLEDFERDGSWHFKIGGFMFSIPKPFELGAMGTLAERTYELMVEPEMTSKRYRERIGHMFSQTFALNPIPQIIKPFVDLNANKDSFSNRAIESMGMEKLKKADRYNERTTMTARFLGQLGLPDPAQLMMGRYDALSPVQVDHLFRAYFGWLGTATTVGLDYGLRPLASRGEKPAMQLRDVFIVGNFVKTLPTGQSRYLTQLYEQANEIEQAYSSYREAVKMGDKPEAEKRLAADKKLIDMHPRLTKDKKQLSDLNSRAKQVESSRDLSAEAKRVQLDLISAQRNRLAEEVSRRMTAK